MSLSGLWLRGLRRSGLRKPRGISRLLRASPPSLSSVLRLVPSGRVREDLERRQWKSCRSACRKTAASSLEVIRPSPQGSWTFPSLLFAGVRIGIFNESSFQNITEILIYIKVDDIFDQQNILWKILGF